MQSNRRDFFSRIAAAGAGLWAGKAAAKQSAGPAPVISPDIPDLPFTVEGGVKVFHLIAEPVKQEVLPGRVFDLWGFNGTAPGPTIQVNEGDRVRIVFENRLPEPSAIHWHGLEIPVEMDGVPGVGQPPVMPGEKFVYEFTLNQHGTFFYHSHMAMQEMMGMLGAMILHPKTPYTPAVDKDFVLSLQEYWVLPNNTVPNSMNMEFNWLTFNGKASPATTPLIVRLGDRVRVRLINLGMDHHPIHLHGFTFWITGHEGARQPESLWMRGNTVLVGVAQARDFEFIADRPGDWMLHCHLPHHMMNHMASIAGPMTRSGGMGNMPGMEHMHHAAEDPNRVPGYPQDAMMESPMMAMDKAVEKPETYGLPKDWSGFMGGMMTLLRILPPEQYEKILALKRDQARKGQAQ